MSRRIVAADEIPENGGKLVEVKGRRIALTGRCPYEMLQCSWHGWEFDIRTGQSYCDPDSIKARTCQVTAESGKRLAKGPFVAEAFPVSVENDYILVEV